MESVNFVFWLQGFFEISEAEELTPKQVEMIRRHMELVYAYEKNPKFLFIDYLNRILKIASIGEATELEIDKAQVAEIKQKLNYVFEHVVDPSYGNAQTQNALNQIHNPNSHLTNNTRPGGIKVRC